MPKNTVNLNLMVGGKEYPCRVTMGAMVRFKRETGRDVSSLTQNDISDLVLFMWCCVVSASKADGVEFDMSFEDFADRLDGKNLESFLGMVGDEASSEGKKKTAAKK